MLGIPGQDVVQPSYEYTYDKIQASEPVRAKAAALVAPVAPAPARGIASSR